jgi:cytochrome c oxidase cbb3-type subunit 3
MASDHDRAEEKSRLRSGEQVRPGDKDDDSTLVEFAWQSSCARCHGPYGRGDGPDGPMVKAQDLTREEWQAKVTDAEMAATIRNGKGQMPKFTGPPKLVEGFVARIRASRGFKGGP